jgi:hypothetical protein
MFNRILVLLVVVAAFLVVVPAVSAQESACIGTVTVPEDVGVAVYGLPSAGIEPALVLQNGDQVIVQQRIGQWLLVSADEWSGYIDANAVVLSGACSFEFDEYPPWLALFFNTAMVAASAAGLAPVTAYLAQLLKLVARTFGLDIDGGKIAVVVGIGAVVVVMAANVLGFVDQLPDALALLETVLGSAITIFASFKAYDALAHARAMPGASVE